MDEINQEELDNGMEVVHQTMDKIEDEQAQENVDNPEAINTAIDSLDALLKDMFLNEYSKTYFSKFRSNNWNKSTPDERKELYANYCTYLSALLGEEFLFPGIGILESPFNGQEITVLEGKIVIHEKLFEEKNVGITILPNIVRELRKYMVNEIIEHALIIADKDFYNKLKGNAKIYYENMAESWLTHSWYNFYTREHDKYGYQPIILDSNKISMDILFEVLKELFNDGKKVDKEMSVLLQSCMDFYGGLARYKEEKMKIIKKNRENFKVHIKEEKIIYEYIKRVTGDLSLLSDDEFFELFNNSFYSIINSIRFDVTTMLENLSNELLNRVFKDFDLTGIELPSYTFELDEENMVMKMSCLYQGEVSEIEVEDSTEIFKNILHMISMLAQKHTLFKFKDDKEKEDYNLMKQWVKLKNENLKDECDQEVINDELNIIVYKVGDLLNEIEEKVNSAIRKSTLLNVGESMLTYYDKTAHIDFNEFKSGYTKDQIQDCLKEYMILDMENMKKEKVGR